MHRRVRLLVVAAVGALIAMNAGAFMHARAMTTFARRGDRTAKPEHQSVWDVARVVLVGVNVPRPENDRTPDEIGPFEVVRFDSGHGPTLEDWHVPNEAKRPLVVVFHGLLDGL